MNVTKTQIDDLNAVIKIELVKEDYAVGVDKKLKDYQKTAAIDGFRKGKVPMGIVRKMHGQSLKVDEINKVIGTALSNYIQENKLNILGEPLPNEENQKELNLDEDNYEFFYDIALSPEVNVNMTKREKVSNYIIDVTEEMLQKQIDGLLESNGTLEDVEVAEGTEFMKGELIELNEKFEKKEDGIDNMDASLSLLHMKDEASLEKFKNKKVGEEVIFDAVKSYPNEADFASMCGVSKEEAKNVGPNFCFVIKVIKRNKKAELNEELFTKLFGAGEVKDEAAFTDRVKADIAKQLEGHSEYRFAIDAKQKLIDKNKDIVLPEKFLKRWILATNEKMTQEQVDADFAGYRDEFMWQLIKTAVITKNEVKVETEDVKAIAREVAAAQLQQYGVYGLADDQLDGFADKLLQDEKQSKSMYDRALEKKVMFVIKDSFKVEDQIISMEEFEKLFEKN